jgi:transcriptional regulator with XRE-family HTH domain
MARARKSDATSIALAGRLRAMRARGVSQREIARRTKLSRLFVSDVLKGTRNISAERAAVAARNLSAEPDELPVPVNGRVQNVEPLSASDRNKLKRYKSMLGSAMRRSDYGAISTKLKPNELKINTTSGPIVLDSDPNVLSELDDAGVIHDILLGESP